MTLSGSPRPAPRFVIPNSRLLPGLTARRSLSFLFNNARTASPPKIEHPLLPNLSPGTRLSHLSHGPISWSLQGDKVHLPSTQRPQHPATGSTQVRLPCLPSCPTPNPCWQESTFASCHLPPATCNLQTTSYDLRTTLRPTTYDLLPPTSFSQHGSLYRRSLLSAGVVTGPLKTCVPTSPAHHHQTKTQRSDEPFGPKQPIGSIALVLTLHRGHCLLLCRSCHPPSCQACHACFPRGALKVADPSILEYLACALDLQPV